MWVGVPEFRAALEKVSREVDLASKAILVESSALVESKAKSNFQGSRKFVNGSRGGRHVVPDSHIGGTQPNVISGDLRRSIKTDPIMRTGFGSYWTRVGPRMVYGRRVELGFNGSQGYPFFERAADDAEREFAAIALHRWSQML